MLKKCFFFSSAFGVHERQRCHVPIAGQSRCHLRHLKPQWHLYFQLSSCHQTAPFQTLGFIECWTQMGRRGMLRRMWNKIWHHHKKTPLVRVWQKSRFKWCEKTWKNDGFLFDKKSDFLFKDFFSIFSFSRHCGRLLCSKCSSREMPIIKYNLSKAVRVCDTCADVITVGPNIWKNTKIFLTFLMSVI